MLTRIESTLTDSFFDKFFFSRTVVGENVFVVEEVFTEKNEKTAFSTSFYNFKLIFFPLIRLENNLCAIFIKEDLDQSFGVLLICSVI